MVYESESQIAPSPKLVRRSSTGNNSKYAVFDNLNTGAVIHIDKDEARQQMYKENYEEQPPPTPSQKKRKKLTKENTFELRKRTVSRVQTPKKKQRAYRNAWAAFK